MKFLLCPFVAVTLLVGQQGRASDLINKLDFGLLVMTI